MEETILPAAQYLRIKAEANLMVAANMRQEQAIRWTIIHKMEQEAVDLFKLAQLEDADG